MTVAFVPSQVIRIAKGQDWPLRFRIVAPETVMLNADALAGATSLTVRPLDDELDSGDKLIFGKNTVITLSAGALAGAVSLAVTAIPGPLHSGDIGQKLRDLTGYTIAFEALEQRGDATPAISKTGGSITILSQVGNDRGYVQVLGLAADTTSLIAKQYYWALWRRDTGFVRPLSEGDLVLSEQGFL